MKLIMSIDSHFEVTENKEDSVRLHLPNYKGNQPMDFHIYLLEPFLFIAFTTEIEGEKISTTNSYPQDMDQQEIFNAATASNLERIHQSLAEKSKNDEENDEIIVKKKDTSSKDSNGEKATYGIVKTWPLLDFARAHGKMQIGEFANKETGEVFKSCIFTKPDGTRTFVAFAAKMGELTPQQIAAMKNELQVVQLESGNYSLCKIGINSWNDVDLDNGEQNSPPQNAKSQTTDAPKAAGQPSAKEEKKANWLSLGDMKRDTLEPYDSIRTSTEIKEWPASTNKSKTARTPKVTKPTPSHYLAMAIDIVIGLVVGISVYNSNVVHLEQDRLLVLVTCCALAVIAWGYPYFDTSVKINHDGCFAQGCIHPIIGVFSIVLFPLFIHYWLYKGIKVCIVQLKKFFDRNDLT